MLAERPKRLERVVVAEDRNAVCPCCVADGERAIEIDAAVVEGLGQRDCVGMERRDEIGAGSKVLCSKKRRQT